MLVCSYMPFIICFVNVLAKFVLFGWICIKLITESLLVHV